jgi:hypothetical protein
LNSEKVITENELPLLPWSAVDYNRDGEVDAADFVVWRKLNGQSGINLLADGNLSGQVNAADYTVWQKNFGRAAFNESGSGGFGAPGVPEPAAAPLVMLATACFAAVSRRFPRSFLGQH